MIKRAEILLHGLFAAARAEILLRKMFAAGDRLILALAVEKEFARPGDGADPMRNQWIECQRTVDRLSDDYVLATKRWHEALEDTSSGASQPQSLVAFPAYRSER